MAGNYSFELRFSKKAIRERDARYPAEYDAEIEKTIAVKAKVRGYFLRDEVAVLRT